MKRYLESEIEIIASSNEMIIEVDQAYYATLGLELTLLVNKLCESLTIRGRNAQVIVLSIHSLTDDYIGRTRIVCKSDTQMEFELSATQAEYLQASMLHAYRDKMAQVEHIHIEGYLDGKPYDLTVFFNSAVESLSEEEALELLKDVPRILRQSVLILG